MKDFDWTSFTLKIPINTNIQLLYDAWSKSGELERWFLRKARYLRTDQEIRTHEESAHEQDTYQWSWYAYDVVESGKVIQANGKDFFQFTFAGECLVDIQLSTEEDGMTIVALTQHQIPTDDNSKKNVRIGCHSGWSFFLTNLKSIYEGGVDLRNKKDNLAGMLNN